MGTTGATKTLKKTRTNYDCARGCPVEATLDVMSGKWKGVILYHLLEGTLRFGELRRRLRGITQRMLTKQLRELEDSGLVVRTVYAEVPPRVEYRLSKEGHSLEPILRALEAWGERRLDQQRAPRSARRSA